jgi:dipeptidase E
LGKRGKRFRSQQSDETEWLRHNRQNALVRDKIVYAGFSASAVIAFANLKGLEFIDDPYDVPPGYEAEVVWDGFGLISYALVVHFESGHQESKLLTREIAFYDEKHIPHRKLRDGEALIIQDGREKIVDSR